MHHLNITSRVEQNAVLFDLSGELDLSNVERARESIHSRLEEGHRDLILNFSGLRYMDSSGLSLLVQVKRRLESQGSVTLVGCPPIIRRMLEVTRLDTVFPAYENDADALRAVAGRGIPGREARVRSAPGVHLAVMGG